MFFEDLSNPKYVSSESKWMFPYIDNYYGTQSYKKLNNSYISRKLPVSENLYSREEPATLLIEVPSCIHDISSSISIEIFTKNSSSTFTASAKKIRTGNVDYYTVFIPNPREAIYFKVMVSCDIRSIKIYGI